MEVFQCLIIYTMKLIWESRGRNELLRMILGRNAHFSQRLEKFLDCWVINMRIRTNLLSDLRILRVRRSESESMHSGTKNKIERCMTKAQVRNFSSPRLTNYQNDLFLINVNLHKIVNQSMTNFTSRPKFWKTKIEETTSRRRNCQSQNLKVSLDERSRTEVVVKLKGMKRVWKSQKKLKELVWWKFSKRWMMTEMDWSRLIE